MAQILFLLQGISYFSMVTLGEFLFIFSPAVVKVIGDLYAPGSSGSADICTNNEKLVANSYYFVQNLQI